MRHSIRAVVIDLDGTLLDTVHELAEAANVMLSKLGRPPVEAGVAATYIGNGVARFVKRCLTGTLNEDPDAALFDQAMPLFQAAYADTMERGSAPFEGVIDGLKALREAGFRLACITNKAERFTLPLLENTGLRDYFELILSGDSLPRRKPDPLPLIHAAEHFGIPVTELLLVGDSCNDTQAARAAGCPVFCVDYGYNGGQDVCELKPDAVVTSLAEVPALITLPGAAARKQA